MNRSIRQRREAAKLAKVQAEVGALATVGWQATETVTEAQSAKRREHRKQKPANRATLTPEPRSEPCEAIRAYRDAKASRAAAQTQRYAEAMEAVQRILARRDEADAARGKGGRPAKVRIGVGIYSGADR